jgi:hypothetical protein
MDDTRHYETLKEKREQNQFRLEVASYEEKRLQAYSTAIGVTITTIAWLSGLATAGLLLLVEGIPKYGNLIIVANYSKLGCLSFAASLLIGAFAYISFVDSSQYLYTRRHDRVWRQMEQLVPEHVHRGPDEYLEELASPRKKQKAVIKQAIASKLPTLQLFFLLLGYVYCGICIILIK